ncbi:tetraacyldisaccharide 4'-kinase [bacterium]|nr:tetraacyldisaccharide 4'-kinase [bacterium]
MRGDFPLDRAAPPRWLTVPMSRLYAWSAGRYHKSWDKREPFRASVPVISVGNLAVGGTGKSPTVIALTELLWVKKDSLREQNAIAILSRGYGRLAKGLVEVQTAQDWRESGDEPLMIKRALPAAAVIVEADRTKGARYAVEKLGAKLILLDDGFQHRPLYRDFDLVMLDARHPLGNGRLLPAGPLREKPAALRRAQALVTIGEEVESVQKLATNFSKPLIQAAAETLLPSELLANPSSKCFVVSGIARPERLYKSLEAKKINVCGKLAFSDHHPFGPADREAVFKTAQQAGAELVLTTAKDQSRMGSWGYALPLLTVGLEIKFGDPDAIWELLSPILSNI